MWWSLGLPGSRGYLGAGRCGDPGVVAGGRGAVGFGVPGFGV